jgi:hypothetical protein
VPVTAPLQRLNLAARIPIVDVQAKDRLTGAVILVVLVVLLVPELLSGPGIRVAAVQGCPSGASCDGCTAAALVHDGTWGRITHAPCAVGGGRERRAGGCDTASGTITHRHGGAAAGRPCVDEGGCNRCKPPAVCNGAAASSGGLLDGPAWQFRQPGERRAAGARAQGQGLCIILDGECERWTEVLSRQGWPCDGSRGS